MNRANREAAWVTFKDENTLGAPRLLTQYQSESGCARAANGTKCSFRCSRYNLEPATSVSGDDDPDAQQDLTLDAVRVHSTRT